MRKNILVGVGFLLAFFILSFVVVVGVIGGIGVIASVDEFNLLKPSNIFFIAKSVIVLWGAALLALFTLFLVYAAVVVGIVGPLASKYPVASMVAVVAFFFSTLLLLTMVEIPINQEQHHTLEEGGYDESDRREIDRLLNLLEENN